MGKKVSTQKSAKMITYK